MRLSLTSLNIALFLLAIPALGQKPSQAVARDHLCPEVSLKNLGKKDWLCDKPPYSGDIFGCSYNTGTGTNTLKCIYDVLTGECQNEEKDCPKFAWDHNKRKRFLAEKRSAARHDPLTKRSHDRL
ncbi:hypothetical protein D9758_012814 [Tetrapyrgos nigripes]|uniref:Secreted protein n=1 Tax=Tetrapyrgos nigripes TaxID=182062 RepID=A0A8H5D086_9AGAR|nr:hypothetical protein D9758_012814 [Tetrapyrgos nigripes]